MSSILEQAGASVVAPYCRGFGATRFVSDAVARRATKIRSLLDRGAARDARDDRGLTAADIARTLGSRREAELLGG